MKYNEKNYPRWSMLPAWYRRYLTIKWWLANIFGCSYCGRRMLIRSNCIQFADGYKRHFCSLQHLKKWLRLYQSLEL